MQKRTINILGSADQIPQKIKGWNHTFQMAKPYIKGNGIGIDIGCREGGFAREMENDLHTYTVLISETRKKCL